MGPWLGSTGPPPRGRGAGGGSVYNSVKCMVDPEDAPAGFFDTLKEECVLTPSPHLATIIISAVAVAGFAAAMRSLPCPFEGSSLLVLFIGPATIQTKTHHSVTLIT